MSPISNTTIGNHTISNMALYCLLDEINGPTASLENARDFLFQKSLLKTSMSCPRCDAAMTLVPCSSSKSPDGLIWRCSPCKKYKNIRADSSLSGQKIAQKSVRAFSLKFVGSVLAKLPYVLSKRKPGLQLWSTTT